MAFFVRVGSIVSLFQDLSGVNYFSSLLALNNGCFDRRHSYSLQRALVLTTLCGLLNRELLLICCDFGIFKYIEFVEFNELF